MTSLILSQIPLEELLAQVRQVVKEEIAAGPPSPITTQTKNRPVTTKELCTYLGVTEPTVLRWRKKKVIPFFCIGSAIRFNLQEVIKSLGK
jgi:excisionase family DNA binding protein